MTSPGTATDSPLVTSIRPRLHRNLVPLLDESSCCLPILRSTCQSILHDMDPQSNVGDPYAVTGGGKADKPCILRSSDERSTGHDSRPSSSSAVLCADDRKSESALRHSVRESPQQGTSIWLASSNPVSSDYPCTWSIGLLFLIDRIIREP